MRIRLVTAFRAHSAWHIANVEFPQPTSLGPGDRAVSKTKPLLSQIFQSGEELVRGIRGTSADSVVPPEKAQQVRGREEEVGADAVGTAEQRPMTWFHRNDHYVLLRVASALNATFPGPSFLCQVPSQVPMWLTLRDHFWWWNLWG